jgi:hypothetical protein
MQDRISGSTGVSADVCRGHRLRCIAAVIHMLQSKSALFDFVKSVIPEIILATKDHGMRVYVTLSVIRL